MFIFYRFFSKFTYFTRNNFQLTASQSRGFITLMIIMLVIWTGYFTYFAYKNVENTAIQYSILKFKETKSIQITTNSQNYSESPKTSSISASKEYFKEIVKFDLNLADTSQLIAIKGIGSKLAIRIVKYRNSLGGFVSINQLNEIFGLKPEVIDELIKHSFISPRFLPKQLSIESDSFKFFVRHPYLEYEHVKSIFNYKRKTILTSIDQLQNDKILIDSVFIKIKPYLKIK